MTAKPKRQIATEVAETEHSVPTYRHVSQNCEYNGTIDVTSKGNALDLRCSPGHEFYIVAHGNLVTVWLTPKGGDLT